MTLFSRTTQIIAATSLIALTLPAFARTSDRHDDPYGMIDISIVNHSGQTATCTLEDAEGDHIEMKTPAGFVLAKGAEEHFKIAWMKAPSSHRYHSLGTVKCESSWYDNPNQGTGYHHQVNSLYYHGELTSHTKYTLTPVHEVVKNALQVTTEALHTTDESITLNVLNEKKSFQSIHYPGLDESDFESWEIHTELTS